MKKIISLILIIPTLLLVGCTKNNLQGQHIKNKDKKITMNTFRMYYQKIAVKVIKHAREYTLSFSSSYNRQKTFIKYWNAVLQI